MELMFFFILCYLKQHILINHTVIWVENWHGLHEAKIKFLWGLEGIISFLVLLGCWQSSVPWNSEIEIPISLLTVSSGSFLASGVHPHALARTCFFCLQSQWFLHFSVLPILPWGMVNLDIFPQIDTYSKFETLNLS